MKKRILVIDDELFFRKVMIDSLGEAGFDVTAVKSGEEAFERMESEGFDLVITDAVLPGMDGFEICRKVKEKRGDLPVIIASALYKKLEHQQHAIRDCGADDFVTKPVHMPDLLRKINRALEQRSGEKKPARSPKKIYSAGNLKDVPFPSILHSIYAGRESGRLEITKGKFKKRVHFRKGYPHYIESNVLSECLGRLLVKEGRISEAASDESILKAKDSKRLQGTVLIEMGLLTPQELKRALHLQLREKLLGIFSWEEGDFSFMSCDNPAIEDIPLHMSTAQVIVEGVRRYYTLQRLKTELDPYLDKYLSFSESPLYRFQDVNLTEEEKDLLVSVNGEKRLDEMLPEGGERELMVSRLFYSLIASKIIEVSATSTEGLGRQETGQEEEEPGREDDIRERLIRDFIKLDSADYYQIFGLDRDFRADMLKRAFFALSRRYHPDRFSRFPSPAIREKSKAIFKRISQAYVVLSDERRRREYDLFLESRVREEADKKLHDELKAEDFFNEGLKLLKQNRFRDAEASLKKAVDLNESDGRYKVYLGWAMHKRGSVEGSSTASTAKDLIKRGIAVDPAIKLSHYFLGSIFKDEGLMEIAHREFEKEIQMHPGCTEALRELRLLDIRQKKEKADARKGIFRGIFK